MNYSVLDDKELLEKIEQAGLAERLVNDPAWGLLQEASKRIIDRAITKFALSTKADDLVSIIELQTIIRKYKLGLFSEIEILRHEGEEAFEEAKNRGSIPG